MSARSRLRSCVVATFGATAGLSSSAGNAVGQANRGTSQVRPVGALIRCVVTMGLCFVAAANAAGASTATDALDALLARLDEINRSTDMTTAKKAIISADEIDKFNQQCKGKPLTLRLKIQDVVPNAKGQCVTVSNPHFSCGLHFQLNLSKANVMSLAKGSELVITSTLSGVSQSRVPFSMNVVEPGCKLAFALRPNANYGIRMENASWSVENASNTAGKTAVLSKPTVLTGGSSSANRSSIDQGKTSPSGMDHGNSSGDTTKNESSWKAEDIKSFFLKGIVLPPHQPGNTTAGLTNRTGLASGTTPSSGFGSASLSRSVKAKHNRVYIAEDLIRKFGKPSVRTSAMSAETWTYNCKDGVVHVHFTQLGFVGGSSASKSEQVRLEATSVDLSSVPARSSGRY